MYYRKGCDLHLAYSIRMAYSSMSDLYEYIYTEIVDFPICAYFVVSHGSLAL